MVTNQSSLSEDWGQLTDWVGDKARAAGQAVGLVDDDLIPGNPETAGELAGYLGKLGGGFEQAGQGFKRIDTGGWQGSAAEGARGFLESCPPRWLKAADAFERAAKAVADYQRVLAESQAKAARAKEDLERAEKASAAARERHNAQVEAFNASDRTGPRPGEFTDPAAGEIAAAKQAIEQAKAAVAEADQCAAREVLAAAAEAPPEPGFFARLGQDMTDLGQGVGRIAGSFLAGAGGAVVELGKLARLVNPTDPWKFAHPGEATEAAKTVAMGVIGAVQNPYAAVKTVVDPDGWRQDPAKNLGSMVPDALASLAGGAGVAGRVARSVGKIADAGTSLGRHGDDLARATPDAPSAPQAPTSQPSAPPQSTSGTPWGQGDLPPSSPQSPTSGTPWQKHDAGQPPVSAQPQAPQYHEIPDNMPKDYTSLGEDVYRPADPSSSSPMGERGFYEPPSTSHPETPRQPELVDQPSAAAGHSASAPDAGPKLDEVAPKPSPAAETSKPPDDLFDAAEQKKHAAEMEEFKQRAAEAMERDLAEQREAALGRLPESFQSDLDKTAVNPDVDPAQLPENTKWRESTEQLFRADSRDWDEIFGENGGEGFAPKGDIDELDLQQYVNSNMPSGYVSTTNDPELFKEIANEHNKTFWYEIDAPGGVDVNATLGKHSYDWESEIAMPGGIRPERIPGRWEVKFDEDGEPYLDNWQANPYYTPIT